MTNPEFKSLAVNPRYFPGGQHFRTDLGEHSVRGGLPVQIVNSFILGVDYRHKKVRVVLPTGVDDMGISVARFPSERLEPPRFPKVMT